MINTQNLPYWTHCGLHCHMVKVSGGYSSNMEDYYYCGYVTVPEEHPLYKARSEYLKDLDVHGGVTYNDMSENGYTIGFDCAHSMDSNTVWTEEAVRAEVNRLAEQLSEVKEKSKLEEICGTCYYFRPNNTMGCTATCRINPPIHEWFKPANSSWDSPFPQTQFTSWCGQYEPKE